GHQRSVDKTSGKDAGLAPHDHVNLRADWRFMRGWRSNAQLNWVGERKREPGDARPPLAGYTTLDLTLRTERSSSPWEFAVSVRNLFNADAREPSPFGVPFVPIPNDFPLPGRSVYVEARWRL
ncbi:TonB-dependent receptor, partial [Piscinibacter sp.]|uniref:TonB-dependent receptor n=1 Tax=Piscinibacter sp. TaxID=1903157 RepID=UPI002F41E079